jgi:hypothetical protein
MIDRASVVALCKLFLPETIDLNAALHWNQIGFDHIAKDYGEGSGTTCGFLPHWLLWRFGCTDGTLVNRCAPEQGLKYTDQQNISRLNNPKAAARIRVDSALTTAMASNAGGPKQGDFIIIRGAFWWDKDHKVQNRDSAHVFVLLDVVKADGKEVVWKIAQAGITNKASQQGGQIITMTGKLREGTMQDGGDQIAGPHLVFVSNIRGEEPNFPRRVSSFIDLGKVSFGPPPNPAFTGLFEARKIEAAKNDTTTVQETWGWYQEANGGAPNMIVIERGHEATRFSKAGAMYALKTNGVWTRSGGRVEIQWRDGARQSWDVTGRPVREGSPVTGGGGALKKLGTKPPKEIPPQWSRVHFWL